MGVAFKYQPDNLLAISCITSTLHPYNWPGTHDSIYSLGPSLVINEHVESRVDTPPRTMCDQGYCCDSDTNSQEGRKQEP